LFQGLIFETAGTFPEGSFHAFWVSINENHEIGCSLHFEGDNELLRRIIVARAILQDKSDMIENICVLMLVSTKAVGHYIVLECPKFEARSIIFLFPVNCYEAGGSGEVLKLLAAGEEVHRRS
jgi:hypothetical protein